MSQSLLFDESIELCGGEVDGYSFEAKGDGGTFGDPQPLEVALNSLVRDGVLTETQSDGNREASFLVTVKATDQQGLAKGVAALHGSTQKRTTLVWTPPDGFGATTVFEVETSSLASPDGFDDLEYVRNRMTVLLRMVCLPYSRSVEKIVDVASSPPGAGEGTVFESCESVEGWAGFGSDAGSASFTVDSSLFSEGAGSVKSLVTQWERGYVYGTSNGTGGYYSPSGGRSRDEVTGLALDTGTGGYVSVAIRFDPFYDASKLTRIWQSTTPGVWTEVGAWAAVALDANGFVHYRWPVDEGQTIIGFRFEATHGTKGQLYDLDAPFVWYDEFRILPTASTEQQIIKQLDVLGSARTTGSLHIGSGIESVALGQVLVATMPTAQVPAGFNPEVRPWVSQGTLTADATALNGSYYSPGADYSAAAGMPVFDVPVRLLTPGAYSMVALVKTSAATLVSGVQAQLNVDGTVTGPTSTAEVSTTSTTSGWQFVTLGTIYLPPVPVRGADPTTTVRLLCKGANLANLYMVPAWQVGGRPVADFSIVDCGTGTASAAGPSSHLWIDSPDAAQPQGGWWRGPTADRLNTRSAWPEAKKPGTHTFTPGGLTAFLASAAAQAPTLALEYYPRWQAMAAL